jgi:hypothetical protein
MLVSFGKSLMDSRSGSPIVERMGLRPSLLEKTLMEITTVTAVQ